MNARQIEINSRHFRKFKLIFLGEKINPKQKNKNGDLYNGQLNLTHIANLQVT